MLPEIVSLCFSLNAHKLTSSINFFAVYLFDIYFHFFYKNKIHFLIIKCPARDACLYMGEATLADPIQNPLIISCRASAWEGDYKMHPVRACGGARVCVSVCHAGFSKTATATDFLCRHSAAWAYASE